MALAVHTFKIGLRQLIEDQKQQHEHRSHFDQAPERCRLAKTHVDPQRVKTKAFLGVTKSYTLKHGLANLIKPPVLTSPDDNIAELTANLNEDEC
ncbi:hypothetical protein DM01DRAFT_1371532 [Hesseltinella vesiculosa]|uniref:Uncharacterized protein n=1 Tax=Hesseltinella vesiculosa TaxID=101127 RepID=A0A1X2GRH2_9FUNG|nr:hypothetical protein DM01DRAFT_1371532 [Hesseltinella vesiculosa]